MAGMWGQGCEVPSLVESAVGKAGAGGLSPLLIHGLLDVYAMGAPELMQMAVDELMALGLIDRQLPVAMGDPGRLELTARGRSHVAALLGLPLPSGVSAWRNALGDVEVG